MFAREMKITIATGPLLPVPPLQGGAVPRIWQGMAEEFARRGHEVCIFARAFPGQPNEEVSENVRYIRWGGFSQSLSIALDLIRDFTYAASVVRRLPKADILVTNDFWLPVFAGWRRHHSRGRIVVNAGRFPKGQFRLYRRTARIAAVSTAVCNAIVKECPVLAARTQVFPNPVDLRSMTPRITLPTDSTQALLYVGRLHPEKGVHLLIAAFGRLLAKHANWRLRLVGPIEIEKGGGGPDYDRQLKELARGAPVDFHGAEFDLHKLADLYRSADVFCYPSLAETGEAFGVAPLEAMACGVAPIVSRLDCFQDFIIPGENGWAFDHRTDDPLEALSATLDEAMSDPAARQRFAQSALGTAQRFSFPAIAEQYLADFTALINATP